MDHDRDAAVVGDAIFATHEIPAPAAAERGLDFQLHVVGEALDLGPATAVAVEHSQPELREVGHEDVGKVDQGRAAAHRIERDDRQCHQDRVGVILPDGLVERRAGRCLVVDVAPDELDAIADSS